jgi:hypothetical protein
MPAMIDSTPIDYVLPGDRRLGSSASHGSPGLRAADRSLHGLDEIVILAWIDGARVEAQLVVLNATHDRLLAET